MMTCLLVNSSSIPLNDFTERYIANILKGIVHSVGKRAKEITLCIDNEDLRIYTEKGEIDIAKRDFARQMIVNTIKGVLSPLKGVLWLQRITIVSRCSGKSPVQEHVPDEQE